MTKILLFGAGTGLGLWLIVIGFAPRPPRLDKALDAPYRQAHHTHAHPGEAPAGWLGGGGDLRHGGYAAPAFPCPAPAAT